MKGDMASLFSFQLQFGIVNQKPKMKLGLLVRLVNIIKLTNSTDDNDEAFEPNLNSTETNGSTDLYPADHLDCTRVYQFIFSVFQCCYHDTNHDKDY